MGTENHPIKNEKMRINNEGDKNIPIIKELHNKIEEIKESNTNSLDVNKFGKATVKCLNEGGIFSAKQLIVYSKEKLMEITCLGEKTIE